MKSVFIVSGSIGSYSDFHEWVVGAFHTEAAAQSFIKVLEGAIQAFSDSPENKLPWPKRDEAIKRAFHTLDPDISLSYEVPSYYAYEVRFRDTV